MTATTPERTATTPERGGMLARFDRVERAVHWTNAILFAVLVVTGAALYFTPLIALVGRRELVERIHLYAGIALPVPLILALQAAGAMRCGETYVASTGGARRTGGGWGSCSSRSRSEATRARGSGLANSTQAKSSTLPS